MGQGGTTGPGLIQVCTACHRDGVPVLQVKVAGSGLAARRGPRPVAGASSQGRSSSSPSSPCLTAVGNETPDAGQAPAQAPASGEAGLRFST